MLAQSFMSAADLDITEPQRGALQKVLVLPTPFIRCFSEQNQDDTFFKVAPDNCGNYRIYVNDCKTFFASRLRECRA